MDRLPIWLAIAALVVGLGSVGANVAVSHASACHAVSGQNAKTRLFVSQLITDPSVTAAAKAQITALALKDFPPQAC